ncbi:MAG: multidrug efflux SMR transporter [Actinomycetota bacterium]|jgi:quaternary ammonium compound-resistance protein SugE|nr:multidrug efflux SMR transporter [Rubrobacter sp.]MDQ3508847.1 multidrug efflux SMR transporter [Actinomycetota bacterium]
MTWIILIIAGLFEVGMVMGLNFSEGFTRLWPSLIMLVSGGISFYLLSVAMQNLPVGTAYAVWTSIGAVGAVTLGILFLDEPANVLRIVGILTVLGGVVLLRVAEGG